MVIIFIFLFALFVFLNSILSYGQELEVVEAVPESNSNSGGGGSIPIREINLEEENYFNMKPGRLKFEFNGLWYGVQLAGIKDGISEFLIINLDDGLNDYVSDDKVQSSFNIKSGEIKEVDLDEDGKADIFIELNGISESVDSVDSADFTVRK